MLTTTPLDHMSFADELYSTKDSGIRQVFLRNFLKKFKKVFLTSLSSPVVLAGVRNNTHNYMHHMLDINQ